MCWPLCRRSVTCCICWPLCRRSVTCWMCWPLCCDVLWRAACANYSVATFCDVLHVLITLLRRSVTCCMCWSLCRRSVTCCIWWSLCCDVLWRAACAYHFVPTFCDVLHVLITLLQRSVTCCMCWSLYCNVLWRAVCAIGCSCVSRFAAPRDFLLLFAFSEHPRCSFSTIN